MKSAATIAQMHFGARGVRGPVEFDLTVDNAPSGTISGSATLTKAQLDSLRKGWFYVQIHAEKAPDGNLWGWLLPGMTRTVIAGLSGWAAALGIVVSGVVSSRPQAAPSPVAQAARRRPRAFPRAHWWTSTA